MTRFRERVVHDDWLERGFDLTPEQVRDVDRFFDTWADLYGVPNVTAYRSQEALTAIYEGGISIFGDRLSALERRNVASVLRAGYVVAAAEASLRYRVGKDPNLIELFRLMEQDHPGRYPGPLAVANRRGKQLADVVHRVCRDPGIRDQLPGFQQREAVFSEISLAVVHEATSHIVASGEARPYARRHSHAARACRRRV